MAWTLKSWWKKKPPSSGLPNLPEPVAGLLSDVGCQRRQNEDSARVVRCGMGRHGDRGLLVVVADGMGGHEAGEVASQAAVEIIEREYRDAKGDPGQALEKAFRAAHSQIFKMAAANPAMSGMGTTCTALALVRGEAWAAHVGDSRLYLVRGDGIYQLSEDHTQCMEMVRKGLMSAAEVRKHEDRNVLIRAMGTRPELLPNIWRQPMPVRPADSFVVCSDGLHDLVSGEEIREVVLAAEPEEACQKLVAMARDRGGYDNITVAVVGTAGRVSLKATRSIEVHE